MGCRSNKVKYYILQKLFKFHKWHMTPVEERPYGMVVIKWCNRILMKDQNLKRKTIVEIGCGLGDILAKIDAPRENKTGYDIDEKAIRAAKIAHPGIRFQVGRFAPDIRGKYISILICVNFLYSLDTENVRKEFQRLVLNNDIQYILTETMCPVTPNYPYSHDMDEILGSDYTQIKQRSFEAAERSRRYMLLYVKNVRADR